MPQSEFPMLADFDAEQALRQIEQACEDLR
jgi:hypothetical protein